MGRRGALPLLAGPGRFATPFGVGRNQDAGPLRAKTAARVPSFSIYSDTDVRNAALNEIALGRRAKSPPDLGRGFIL